MGLTRLQLIPKVRDRLSVTTDDAILTTAVLYNCINDGISALADEYDWPWLTATDTVALTTGDNEYDLPDDFIRVHVADIDGDELEYIEYSDFLRYRNVSSAQPRKFTIVGSSILVTPTPNTTYTLNLLYQREDVVLSDDTDETYCPARRANLLVTYAAIYAAVKVRDAALMTTLEKLRSADLERALSDIHRGTQGPSIQTRKDNWAS
jgi:hypothetical protein